MITIQAGKMIIPEEERFVGFAGDNHSNSKQFILPEQHIYGRTYSLYLRFDDGRVTSAALSPQSVDGGTALTWDIAQENLLKPGIVMAQLKVADRDGTVTHYGSDYFIVSESAEFADDGGEIDILSRTEFEERMAQAVSDVRATAPYIGDDGYWYVYSPQQGEYVRSWSANNITVDSAVSASSANPVENRAVKAYVDAADSLKVDTTRKVAGHALDHNITPSELYDSLAGQINPRLVEAGTTPGYPAQYGRTMDGHKPVYCSNLNTWVELAKASDIPDVPTKTSDLTNDSGFLTSHQDISGKEDKSNKVDSISYLSTDDQYPSARCVYNKTLGVRRMWITSSTFSNTDSAVTVMVGDTLRGIEQYDFVYNSYIKRLYICTEARNTSSNNGTAVLTPAQFDIGNKENKASKTTALSAQSTDVQYPSAKCVYNALSAKADSASSLAGYGIADAYTKAQVDALVPTKTSDLTNDSGFLTQHQDISLKENISNKVASVQNSSSTTEYPSVAAMTAYVGGQGFLTQHQDISSKENISNKVATVQNSSSTTEYPSVAAMTAYVGAQGFLTQHQDISGKSDLILTFVPANAAGTQPDLTSSEFASLAIGQAFFSVLQGSQLLFIKTMSGNSAGAYRVQQDISGKENTSNKVTSLSGLSTDTQYPSAKCVYDANKDLTPYVIYATWDYDSVDEGDISTLTLEGASYDDLVGALSTVPKDIYMEIQVLPSDDPQSAFYDRPAAYSLIRLAGRGTNIDGADVTERFCFYSHAFFPVCGQYFDVIPRIFLDVIDGELVVSDDSWVEIVG